MFTGIVQAVGELASVDQSASEAVLWIHADGLGLEDVRLGDSIAVNGVCLTVVTLDGPRFRIDASPETLRLTSLGQLEVGSRVNLEKALRLADRLGGHLVSGHVDGVGEISDWVTEGRSVAFAVRPPTALLRYIAPKGSICLDGVSLTVNRVDADRCWLQLIPHTLEHTTLGRWDVGQRCNIEVDLLARYVERLQQFTLQPESDA